MAECFSCGGNFSEDVNALLSAYKRQYEKYGTVRYYYKLKTGGAIMICRGSSFNTILQNEIKPNFSKGAEFAHISEFK